ncbi:MAG: ssDNA-binding domain-containing protein [Clostridiales bacterium]|nr:ssDNA-binding domain-containing protein [Clostridiales bacterium]
MNNYDDLFNNSEKKTNESKTNENNKSRPFDKNEWIEKKKLEREEAYHLLDTATEEITQDAEKFRDFLNTQAQFDRYSVSNALLIAYQHPNATRVADFSTWKENDVSINKGEKAITMLEPGNEFTREDGTTGFSVNVKKVFDISQTSISAADTRRKIPDERTAIKALIASSPCKIVLVDELKTANARYSPEKDTIFIVRQLEANEIFRSLAFEFGIAKCYQNGIERKDAMFPAYCSAYILCERNGFETGDFNFEKVPEQFKDKESKDIRKELGAVRDMANEISQDISREIEAIEKGNRSKDNGAR